MKKVVVEFIRSIADGGAETLVKDYAVLIDKEKFEIIVVCLMADKKSANYEILMKNGIKIIEIYPKWNFLVKCINFLFGENIVSNKLLKIIKENSVNVIHSHVAVLKYIKPISNKIKEINLLYTCHNLPEKYFGNNQERERKACKYLITNNELQLVALHSDMARELNEMFGIKNTTVVNNGIDFRRFESVEENKDDIRESLCIPRDAFVIGNIGKFSKQKNHDFILNVFSKVIQKNEKSHLLLIGAGELEKQIKERITELEIGRSVTLLSHRKDIPRLLKAMDCFLFPSLFEGLGIAVVEAQKSGIKTVIADTVPNSAYLSSNLKVLSLNDDIDDWVNAILYDSYPNKTFGDINEWDMNMVIKKIEELYGNN